MMFKPWDCAHPDEWLPQSLRLCWGSSGGGYGGDSGGPGMGDGGSGSYGGGYDGGFGGASTGGGDWGSAGNYDASSFNAASPDAYATALGDSPGGFFDTGGPGIAPGALGAEFGGGFGLSGTSGQPGTSAFGAELDAGGGGTSGLGNAIASWGLSTVAGGPGAGTGADLSGGFGGVGVGTGGGAYGGGGFGGWGGSGGGSYGGGGYGGGGGGKGGSAFGGFGSGTLGASNAIAAAPTGPTGSTFADSYGGGSVAGPAAGSVVSSDTSSLSDDAAAPSQSDAPSSDTSSESDTSSAPSESDFGAPTTSEAAPEAEAGPSLSDAAPAGMIHGGSLVGQDNASSETTAAPSETEAAPSAFGPQSVNADYQGSPYASNYDQSAPSQSYQAAAQTLSDLTQSALSGYDYQGAPYADMGQPDSTNWGSVFEGAAGPSQAYQDVSQQLSDLTQSALAPDVNWGAVFEGAAPPTDAPPGWNPAEQTMGKTGLAEPTDWGANPFADLAPSSQAYQDAMQALSNLTQSALDPPTGMDLAGDLATPEGDINPNSLFQSGWAPDNAYAGRGADDASGRAAQDYVTSLVSAAPMFAASPAILSTISALTGISVPGLLGGTATTGGLLGLLGIPGREPTQAPQQQVTEVELVPADQAPPPPDLTPPPPPPPPPQEAAPVAPTEATPATPTEAAPVTPSEAAPVAPPEAAPAAPPQAAPVAPTETTPETPPEAQPAPPSLVDMVTVPPQEAAPTAPPGLTTMLPPPALTPQVQPTETQPQQQPAPADEHDDAPEPQDTSQPPQDPNAPRPPENIPGQPIGSRGTYQNERADNPRTNQNYRDSGRTDYPQGRPGVTFRTARQAGIEPQFRIGDINVGDLDARLVDAINRAMADMPANIRGTLEASSGYRPAHRGEAIERGMDPRTSQESVYSRGHPSNGGGGFPSAQPGRSNHGDGRAIDFRSSPALTWLRDNAARYGLETIRGDHPHIQLRGAGSNVGPRPGEREQADQRARDAQTRQVAQDRGLLGPGRGTQLAGVPTPRARPTDAPQVEIAQPQPPADVPVELPANIPRQQPAPPAPAPVDRPPADISAPAPFLSPPRAGRADPALQAKTASQIAADLAAKGPRPTSQAEGQTALNGLARALAQAGIPAAIAQRMITETARAGARAAGFDPDGIASSYITSMAGTAMQGYAPAKPGEVQGPYGFQPDAAPGKQGALPFGQQFAGGLLHLAAGGRDAGQPPAIQGFPGRDYGEGEIIGNPNLMIEDFGFGPPPPAPPTGLQDPNNPDRSFMITPPFSPDLPGGPYADRYLAKGGHVAKDEPVVVGEEGPETFVPDQPGTVVPHMPQARREPSKNIDRWPKLPAPDYPGRYGGVEREMLRQTRAAQNPSPGLMDMIDSGRLRLNDANWRAMLNDPSLIALGRSRMDDRREGIDPGAEQYGTEQPGAVLPVGTYIPTPAPAADPNNPMAQALGYGSIKRRPMQIGRQSY